MSNSADMLKIRALEWKDITASFRGAKQDFLNAPVASLFFASIFVLAGLVISIITWMTGTTYWLILAAMGFPLLGALASVGFYEISRLRADNTATTIPLTWQRAWNSRNGQLPWLASIIVMIFLFWFFLGHMIFALFLGLAPMQNIFSSFDVLISPQGLQMLAFGTLVGAAFAILVFAISVHAMPMLIDREVDFVSAMITSLGAVFKQPLPYIAWGLAIGLVTFISMLPFFLGLLFTMPLFGFMTWHLYKRLSSPGR